MGWNKTIKRYMVVNDLFLRQNRLRSTERKADNSASSEIMCASTARAP